MGIIDEIKDALKKGQSKKVTELIRIALEEGATSRMILEEGFLAGMEELAARFSREEIGVPEILCITRALDQGVDALHRYTGRHEVKEVGTAVIGTVNGDLHDMGKNLVKLMLAGSNIQVVDLGVNVSPLKFYNETVASKAEVVCLSGIMPGTAKDMRDVIEEFEFRGAREDVFIMVGGYHMDENLAREIGADAYTTDAASCADIAYKYLTKKKRKKR